MTLATRQLWDISKGQAEISLRKKPFKTFFLNILQSVHTDALPYV